MVDENLARIRDKELMKLFDLSSTPILTRRAKQVLAELERRGYLFDLERKDFVTCEQWNARHGDMPIDCEQQARRLDRS